MPTKTKVQLAERPQAQAMAVESRGTPVLVPSRFSGLFQAGEVIDVAPIKAQPVAPAKPVAPSIRAAWRNRAGLLD